MVRWHLRVNGLREIRKVLGSEGDPAGESNAAERVRGFAVLQGDEDIEALLEPLFLLVGLSTLDSPPARFQPLALPDVLDRVKAVIILHRDKHGAAVGFYTREPLKIDAKLAACCEKEGTLLVPFAIPPMLARWDRALAELRAAWSVAHTTEFPVPTAPEPSTWEPRRRRRRRNGEEEEVALELEVEVEEDLEVAELPVVAEE